MRTMMQIHIMDRGCLCSACVNTAVDCQRNLLATRCDPVSAGQRVEPSHSQSLSIHNNQARMSVASPLGHVACDAEATSREGGGVFKELFLGEQGISASGCSHSPGCCGSKSDVC